MFDRLFGRTPQRTETKGPEQPVLSPAPVALSQPSTSSYNKPTTREELDEMFRSHSAEHGSHNTASALEKTNRKYLMAKQYTPFGESEEAEKTAVEGMHDLFTQNPDLMQGNKWSDHHKVQQMDRAYHQSVVQRPSNPYGPLTTGMTRYTPTWMRTGYSGTTAYIPHFSSPTSKPLEDD